MISSELVAEAQVSAGSAAEARDGPAPPLPVWTTQVHIGAVFEGGQSYHAQVFRDKQCLCHIVMAGTTIEAERADAELAIRVRNWIEAFETRDVSDFVALQAS